MSRDRKWAEEKARDLVKRMTLKQKMSQLIFNAPAIGSLGIPAYNWWNEALHGVARAGTATVFPQAIALGASFNPELVERVAQVISTEARAKYNEAKKHRDYDIYKGLTFWSPNVNIFRDPRWGRGQETYGEDPYLTSLLGCAFVKGMQQDGKFLKTAACAKHFAVHSGPEEERHFFNAVATAKDMEETYLPAFKALVTEAEVEAVMGAYNRTNGEPCCASPFLQKKLREEWVFKGHFVSDCWAIRDFHENHKVTKTIEESAALALNNGCDVNCGCTYNHIQPAYNKKLVSEEVITKACERLFTTRYLLGMFDETEWDNLDITDVETSENLELAYDAAVEGSVMLKNSGILPLSGEVRTIGVIGPNADNRTALYGNYHGTSSAPITPLAGIRREAEKRGIRVLYSTGCPLSGVKDDFLAQSDDRRSEALAVAEHSDVVVLVLGLDETLEGEQQDVRDNGWGADKKTLHLPGLQEKLLERVVAVGKPVILVIEAGSSVDLNYAAENTEAIIDIWYPGAMGGKALADIIFGNASPSGKLPITIYKSLENMPEYGDYSLRNRTYKYVDDSQVLFPFGYGLTYGKAEVASVKSCKRENSLDLVVSVKSSSDVTETLEVYIKNTDSPYSPKNSSLCAVKKVYIKKDEEQEVVLSIAPEAFTTVNDEGARSVFGKEFELSIGFSQNDSISKQLLGFSPTTLVISYPF